MFRQDIAPALEALRWGGIILYPTDTVWGIGCDATNPQAVNRIYTIKQRNQTQSMLTLVDSLDMLRGYVEQLPYIALQLIDQATKPITIIYPQARNLAYNLMADNGSVGIRIVKEPFCQQLIDIFGKPIVSTSANISGESTPATFDEISQHIRNTVDYVVRWRQTDRQPATPSAIIQIKIDGTCRILR